MFRKCVPLLAKRTPGYVFWRQKSLTDLQNSNRSYLSAERAVPVAEIVRRMAKVQSRYEDSKDYHERNLLRGEYKYFSGKVLDLRAAQNSDMVGFLRCCAFFQFWDTAQIEKVMSELLRNCMDLTPQELSYCFISLPALRKQQSVLYSRVAELLVDVVEELTLEECLQVCVNCDDTVPVKLFANLISVMAPQVGRLTPSQIVVDVIDPLSGASDLVQRRFSELFDSLLNLSVTHLEELDCIETAIVYTVLKNEKPNLLSEALERKITRHFVDLVEYSCPKSTAMMFAAVADSNRAVVFDFTEKMGERVLFLSTDFTTEEFLSVFRVYMNVYSSTLGIAMTATSLQDREKQFVLQREGALRQLVNQLTEQLVSLIESASSYVSRAQQLEILSLYEEAVSDVVANAELDAPSAGVDPQTELVKKIPATRTVLRLVANKVIASIPQYTFGELLSLLRAASVLGSHYLQDAVVVATLREILTRPMTSDVLEQHDRPGVVQLLNTLSGLREEHQRTIQNLVVPKLMSVYSQ
ncbi:hypothetical protein AGDE_09314 [Angomonas deanei]|uniref:Mitochondrial RNA binding complex 1 subunit n=1 Tax=Angomonas deanei TaxID=59799 RepID=A0A7G2CJ46_9TRYP|nr:hypothetical protein AGDE_09314 [Angomonas deanei]CAD2219439.1 hypothetical protein, conserved [Angomonas deanei]|eukprot:EPY30692.1 hypothetical protein AGDE_09314 [Angomonas deanei]